MLLKPGEAFNLSPDCSGNTTGVYGGGIAT